MDYTIPSEAEVKDALSRLKMDVWIAGTDGKPDQYLAQGVDALLHSDAIAQYTDLNIDLSDDGLIGELAVDGKLDDKTVSFSANGSTYVVHYTRKPSRREQYFSQELTSTSTACRSGVDQHKARGRSEVRQDTTHAMLIEAWALGLLAETRQQDQIDVTDEELRTLAEVAGRTAANDGLDVLTECLQSSIYDSEDYEGYTRKGRWAADVLFRMGIETR